MAHRPVGSGTSITTTAVSAATTHFSVQGDTLRVVALGADTFVAIGTAAVPTATTTDYLIPSNGTATLALTKASQRVVGITTGTTTIISCPEGTQMPFVVGNRVTLSGANEPMYNSIINYAEVTSVDTTAGVNGYHQTRITVAADTSGIVTAFASQDATLRAAVRVAARTTGASGTLYIQQVQISGQA